MVQQVMVWEPGRVQPPRLGPLTSGTDDGTGSGLSSEYSGSNLPTAILGKDFRGRNWELYEERLQRLEGKYQDKLKYYKPDHPAMGKLKQEIAQVRKDIEFESDLARRRLQARYDALKIQQEALNETISN
jgi:hypothetical protein